VRFIEEEEGGEGRKEEGRREEVVFGFDRRFARKRYVSSFLQGGLREDDVQTKDHYTYAMTRSKKT
jgi:hypothetical protein